MLKILSHKRNANQNYTKIPSHPSQIGGMAQMVEGLPSKHRTLSSNPNTTNRVYSFSLYVFYHFITKV
jgi:hypothetical protein